MLPSTSAQGGERVEIIDSDLRVKKTRASKPKVKTGCQTCKFVYIPSSHVDQPCSEIERLKD
jgi:hypothetical protein